MAEDKDKRSLPQTFRDAWMGLIGAIGSAEGEVQKRLYEALGFSPDANLAGEILARVRKQREELERRVDEGVRSAVARVRAPIDKELSALRQRVERLQEKVEERRRARAASAEKKDTE